MKQKCRFDLEPTIKVGEFRFGDEILNTVSGKNLIRIPDEENDGVEWGVIAI